MNGKLILEFLSNLEQNNNRDWYHQHKPELQQANRAFEELLGELILKIRQFDDGIPLTEPKELTFKLVRDTRFSHDKSPYHPAFRAHIAPKGKLPVPVGYYIMIKPGGRSFLGGGLFADMFKDATDMVRSYIAAHGEEWRQIVEAPSFAGRFTVGGTALKNVPRGYDPAHPEAAYLKNKSWYLEDPVSDDRLLDGDFIDYAAERFRQMKSFNDFLNKALLNFQMPERK